MMSILENIYLYTGGKDIEDVASRIAQAIGGEVAHERDRVAVWRPLDGNVNRWISGDVRQNMFYENPPDPHHPSVTDLFDISYDLWCHGCGSEESQQEQASSVFADLTRLQWPALLVHNGAQLLSAWAPAVGRTDFPPETSPDEDDRDLWAPYADPATITDPGLGSAP